MIQTPTSLRSVQVKVLDARIGSQWPMPEYQTSGSAAMDLIACTDETVILKPKDCLLIPTGLSIYIKDNRYCAKILPRSGLGHKHGIVLGNGTGLIDSDYQGPLLVSCLNRGTDDYPIVPGDRIAQLVFVPIVRPELDVVQSFCDTESERGSGGFGSTGK